MHRPWVNWAIKTIEADYTRSADTHLIRLDLKSHPDVLLYLKDESTHPTGSLKHRLARSLFLYALCNGHITENTPIIESSSGSTAVSEAYFAKLLGLDFIAVVPKSTAHEKIKQIEFYGGRCHLVEQTDQIYSESQRLADELNGHYMDQFTYAERATDWRGNNNIAESIFKLIEFGKIQLLRIFPFFCERFRNLCQGILNNSIIFCAIRIINHFIISPNPFFEYLKSNP